MANSSQQQFAEQNMSKPEQDPMKILLDLIKVQHGPSAAVVMNDALKTQKKQIEEAMIDHGMTADDIAKSKGIDLEALANPQKGFMGRWQDNFNKQVGNVTNTDVLSNLLKASEINKNNQQNQGFNTEENMNKMIKFQGILDEQFPGHFIDQTAEGEMIIKTKSNDDNLMLGMREDQFKQKQLQRMGDDLDPSKNVRNPYGVAQLNLSRAERIEGLVSQYKDFNLDRRETEEMAIALNSMLQGSNVSARSQVMSLVPQSARGNFEKFKEWLVNEPKGLNQQKFVKRMFNDVLREKKVFEGQTYKFARAKLAKYSDIRKQHPEEWNDIVRSFGIDPDVYDKWKEEGFKNEPPIDAGNINNSQQESTKSGSNDRYEEYLKIIGQK